MMRSNEQAKKKAQKKTDETLIHKLQNEQLRSKSPTTSSNASE
jgi:hypothetical protein